MKPNKTLIVAVGVLIIAGATAVVLISRDSDPATPAAGAGNGQRNATANDSSPGLTADGAARSAARAKIRETPDNADLVAKYGEARTNLSKHVSTNVVGIMEDAVEMGEMMTSGAAGAFGGGGMAMALGRLGGDLQLTPEQREKAAALFKDYQKRQMERSRAAVTSLKQDPTALMRLMLASDASARGELSDEEYKSLQEEAGKDLAGVINPLDRKNMGGGSPLRDSDFVNDFKAILDPTQTEKVDAALAERQAAASADPNAIPGVEEGNIAGMPKMELEKLDSSIEAARKVTTGIKTMMDGFGGLRDMMPQPAPAPAPEQAPEQPPAAE
jgi:hypothetical protein